MKNISVFGFTDAIHKIVVDQYKDVFTVVLVFLIKLDDMKFRCGRIVDVFAGIRKS